MKLIEEVADKVTQLFDCAEGKKLRGALDKKWKCELRCMESKNEISLEDISSIKKEEEEI